MSKHQLLLCGGLVLVKNETFERVSILVTDGLITALLADGDGPKMQAH